MFCWGNREWVDLEEVMRKSKFQFCVQGFPFCQLWVEGNPENHFIVEV